MRSLCVLTLLLAGCVVKYGSRAPGADAASASSTGAGLSGGASAARGEDFSALEARIDALLVNAVELDQRDRLMAAADFARMSRRLAPEAQAVNFAFLNSLLSIEERGIPYAAPVLLGSGRASASVESAPIESTPIESAPIESAPVESASVESAPVAAPAPGPDVEAMLASAREQLAAGDEAGAMASLEPCRSHACWEQVAPLWAEARDAVVFEAREAAGARYLESRSVTDPVARAAALREVHDALTSLLQRYPDSRYVEAIQRNLTLVESELATIGAR